MTPASDQTNAVAQHDTRSADVESGSTLGTEHIGALLGSSLKATFGEPEGNGGRLVSGRTMSLSRNSAVRSAVFRQAQQTHGNRFVQRALSQSIQRNTTRDVGGALVSSDSGNSLGEEPLQLMESRFQHDFSDVRIHTDDKASHAADSLGANAFTTGRDIYFAKGKYQPGTTDGDRLLAHELTHTVQQSGPTSFSSSQFISEPGDAVEVEADKTADQVISGGSVSPVSRSTPLLARDPVKDQKDKEARYSVWVRSALIDTLVSDQKSVEDFVKSLLQYSAGSSLSTDEQATLHNRAEELKVVNIGNWDVVTVPRLIAAVSGLPAELTSEIPSVGTETFLRNWVRGITEYLAAPDSIAADQRLSDLISAIELAAARFGSISAFLTYELLETLSRLVELREQLNNLKDDPAAKPETNLANRRAIGEDINRNARHALLLNQALSDKNLTAIPIDPSSPTPLATQLAPLRTRLDQTRQTELQEQSTLKQLGPTSDRLAVTSLMGVEVGPEEAFPQTTDKAAEIWTKNLTDRTQELYEDMLKARSKVIPTSPPNTIEGFGELYDRWFTFLPTRAIKADPYVSESVNSWRQVFQGLATLGFEGWMAGQLLKPVGYSIYGTFMQPTEWSPVRDAKLRESTSGQGVIPQYEFVHELRPEYGLIETHQENRELAVQEGVTGSQTTFNTLWTMQRANIAPLEVAKGLNLVSPEVNALFLNDPELAKGWHYLVQYQSIIDETYNVAEQKTMSEPVASYLGAAGQLRSSVKSQHTPRTSFGAPLGEQAIRKGGIESAQGTSQAKYGLTSQDRNPVVEAQKAAYQTLRDKVEKGDLSPEGLIRDLEKAMTDALRAYDDDVFRIGSVLHISWREHDLADQVKQYFKPEVLLEAVVKALAIGLMLKALAQLGPIGRLLSNIIGEILKKSGIPNLGLVLMLISWIDDARRVQSFEGARAQAFFAVDVVDALAQFVQDKVVGFAAHQIQKWGNPERWAPKTTRDVSEAIKAWLSPDQVPQALDSIRTTRERLEKAYGPDHPEVKQLKALEADLGGTPAGAEKPAPIPLEQTTLETRLKDVAEAAQKAGVDPAKAVETARAEAHADLKKTVEDAMGPLKPGETAPIIEVVPSDQIGGAGSKRTAKVVVEDGKVTKILIDENATKAAAYEEGVHAAQSKDPAMRKLFDQLDPGKPWADMSPKEKIDATKAAVQIEIDAKRRMAEQLETSPDPLAGDELIRSYEDINNLRAKQLELAQIKPRKIDEANLPDIISEPATLYSKRTKPSLKIEANWSKGTFSDFLGEFEKANPNHNLTQREIQSLFKREKRALNPNRALEDKDIYDVVADPGTMETLPLKTKGKRSETELLVTQGQRNEIERLLAARDKARRDRNDALQRNDDGAAKKYNQKVVDASQKLGEQAADVWSRQRAWQEGARPTRVYGGEGSRSGDFDRVDKWVDEKGVVNYLVIEAKGGEGKLGGKWYNDKYVQQGSKEYFLAILDDMSRPTSSKAARNAAAELRSILSTGKDLSGNKAKLNYEMVQLPVEKVDAPRTTLGNKSAVEEIEVTPFQF